MTLSNRGARKADLKVRLYACMLGRRFEVGFDSGEPGGGGVTFTTGSGGSSDSRRKTLPDADGGGRRSHCRSGLPRVTNRPSKTA